MKTIALLVTVFFSTIAFRSMAQTEGSTYTHALGVKAWDGAGVTYKYFLKEKAAVEAIVFFSNKGIRATGLYEFHFQLGAEPGLRWYVGPGVHLGMYNNTTGNGVYPGLDGVIGVEYNFKNIPLNASIDWQPAVEFGKDRGFIGSWGGLAVRYIF